VLLQKLKNPTLIILAFFLAIILCMATFLVFQKTGLRQQYHLKQEIMLLENRNDSLQKQLEKQEAIIKRLTYDSLYIESIARTKFGMMKKDEVGFQFVDIEKAK
jgi:cell division protein FtsB